jgi:hypothetical protein
MSRRHPESCPTCKGFGSSELDSYCKNCAEEGLASDRAKGFMPRQDYVSRMVEYGEKNAKRLEEVLMEFNVKRIEDMPKHLRWEAIGIAERRFDEEVLPMEREDFIPKYDSFRDDDFIPEEYGGNKYGYERKP